MKASRRPGFTLVEVLMAVVLVGVLATSALGPMVFLVEKLRGVRDEVSSFPFPIPLLLRKTAFPPSASADP